MRRALIEQYLSTRAATEALAAPLSPEDQLLQAFPDASPTKWHRAHTTWFFETFILKPHGVPPVHPDYGFLFNSYYETFGPRHERPKRGLLSRPSSDEVAAWRRVVDGRMVDLLASCGEDDLGALGALVALGIAHEEQHQELILTDILAALHENPTRPAYRLHPSMEATRAHAEPAPLSWVPFAGALVSTGHDGPGFAFDNESPRHRVYLEPFALAQRLVTVRELTAFIEEGGYETPSLWLSDGWAYVQARGVRAPGYARLEGGRVVAFTLEGERELSPAEPLSHVSYYEADAIARFLGARLPTEAEWEHAAERYPVEGCFRDAAGSPLSPSPAPRAADDELVQLFGDTWEWTQSGYSPYPGFSPAPGAVGEYNGKFMVSQQVLRGGSVLSNRSHLRPTYRNFWPPGTRFQMTGLRLAKGLDREER